MIEPELKPAPAGLEALGKVIALRTGKAPLTAVGEGATDIDAIMEKVAGFEAGEGLDIDATLEGVATTASANSTAHTVLDSAGYKTDAMLSASNDGSPELKLAISAKNTPVNTQTAASISVSTSMSDSAKASLGISTQVQPSGSIAEKSTGSVTPQVPAQLSANTMPTQNATPLTHGDRAPATGLMGHPSKRA